MNWLRSLLYLSATFMCIAIGLLALSIRQTSQDVSTLTRQLGKDSADLKQMVNATLYLYGDAAKEIADTTREQKKYWKATSQQSVKILEHTDRVLAQTEATIAQLGQVAQSVDASQKQVTEESVRTLAELQLTLKESQNTLKASTLTIQSAGKILDDKNIPLLLDHIELTSEHIESTTASVDKVVTRLTKPAAWWKGLVKGLTPLASQLRIVFGGIH